MCFPLNFAKFPRTAANFIVGFFKYFVDRVGTIYLKNRFLWSCFLKILLIDLRIATNLKIESSKPYSWTISFMWLQRDSNPHPVSSKTNTQIFSETGQTIELCCENLFARCIWLYVLIMSYTRFWVNLHSILTWMSRNSLLETGTISEVTVTGFKHTSS